MKIVYMGTPDFAAGILEAVIRAGHDVPLVVSRPDKPAGRHHEMKPTEVKKTALAHGIPVSQPASVRDPAFLEEIRKIAPDVIVVAAFGRILPPEILHMPPYGCLNVHASLLPKYRGSAPIQWAVINGEKKSGVTIMQMAEGLDTGDILTREEIALAPDETGGSLFERLRDLGAELLVRTLNQLGTGEIHPERQPEESPTAYARMITKADGRIDWSMPAVKIERLVRGLNPWPSAYTSLQGRSLKIWKSRVCGDEMRPEGSADAVPGTVLSADESGLEVMTGSGLLLIEELQMEGRKRMDAGEFLRGHRVAAGTILG